MPDHEMGSLDHELPAAALMRVQERWSFRRIRNEQYSRLFSGWHRVEFQAYDPRTELRLQKCFG